MLFAIRYIFYRHYDRKDGSPFEDISLLVLDTKRFARGTFSRDLDLIAAYEHYDNDDKGSLRAMGHLRATPGYYFGRISVTGIFDAAW